MFLTRYWTRSDRLLIGAARFAKSLRRVRPRGAVHHRGAREIDRARRSVIANDRTTAAGATTRMWVVQRPVFVDGRIIGWAVNSAT